MKMLLTVFGVIVALLALILGGSYGVAKAFRHFGVSEDVVFFIGVRNCEMTKAEIIASIAMIILAVALWIKNEENAKAQNEIKRLNRLVGMAQKFSSFARMRTAEGSVPIVLIKYLSESPQTLPRYEAIFNGEKVYPWAESVYFEVPLDEMSTIIKDK